MLKLINITKSFKYGKQSQLVLNNINLNFKKAELVFILGPSGSGKSTLLNIIGTLITPDSGSLYLDNECITKYSQEELNYYRNNMIGFIFQNYHLIEHMTVLDNLKICQNHPNYQTIDNLLKQLNLSTKKYTEVSCLSGGEKQRVAIARALINSPSIIICDEPTGALDSYNAHEVMKILKKLSLTKLVIVVSHDKQLATTYASRIITIKDGQIEAPPVIEEHQTIPPKNSKINCLTILKLAFKNLLLTKKRTILTSFASSIGIAIILIIAFLSTGFNQEIKNLETNLVSKFPITIKNTTYELPSPIIESSSNKIIVKNNDNYHHTNKITSDYLSYLNNNKIYQELVFHNHLTMPIITDSYKLLPSNCLTPFPSPSYLNQNYQLVAGTYPANQNEIILQIDSNHNISQELADSFNLPHEISYDTIINRQIAIYPYLEFINSSHDELKTMYNTSPIILTITGIVKEQEIINDTSNLLYNQQLISQLDNYQSNKENTFLTPHQIDIYFANVKNKEDFLKYLDKYQTSKIIYEDPMKDTISIVNNFINIITIILIFFSIISVFVSAIMTSLLTTTRIMERIKEIGILRSLGASRQNIKFLFNFENTIISIISSIIATTIAIILKTPINYLLESTIEISNIYHINYQTIFIIFIINTIIITLSGLFPVTKASKLDIVECLRYTNN